MSEEGNENEEIIDAQSEDNNSEEPEEPWQMQILHELLTLGSVEDYTVSELQHVVSTHSALKQVLPSFYEAYENTFQGIHDQQEVLWANSRGLTPKTVRRIYQSVSTPLDANCSRRTCILRRHKNTCIA